MTRRRGRPAQGGSPVDRDAILDVAMQRLQTKGTGGVSLRGLASEVGVDPMTLHHHFGGYHGLMRALGDRQYEPVLVAIGVRSGHAAGDEGMGHEASSVGDLAVASDGPTGTGPRAVETATVSARIGALLRDYAACVHATPSLTLAIFAHPDAFPPAAHTISTHLLELLVDVGWPREAARAWRDVLVDYVHGAALARALGPATTGAADTVVPAAPATAGDAAAGDATKATTATASIDPLDLLLDAALRPEHG